MEWEELKDRLINSGYHYFHTDNGILLCGDCKEIIPILPASSIHLVVTSPPYNVLDNGKHKRNSYNLYRDNNEHSEYIAWLSSIFMLLYDKLCVGGRLCVNIGDGKNGRVPTHCDLISNLKEKYLIYAVLIWNKYQTGNRTAWGSFCSPSSPSFPTPFEYIIIFSKDSYRLSWKGETDLTRAEFISWSLALWEFLPETQMKKYGHPAMFPEEMPKRLIKLHSYVGDVVLDPFCGAGTTCVVAEKLNRKWIGIEIDPKYCEITKQRLCSNSCSEPVQLKLPFLT